MPYRLKKFKGNRVKITFHKKFFEKLLGSHPMAISIYIDALVKYLEEHFSGIIFDDEQQNFLEEIVFKIPANKDLTDHYFIKWLVAAFRILDLGAEKSLDMLDEICNKYFT